MSYTRSGITAVGGWRNTNRYFMKVSIPVGQLFLNTKIKSFSNHYKFASFKFPQFHNLPPS